MKNVLLTAILLFVAVVCASAQTTNETYDWGPDPAKNKQTDAPAVPQREFHPAENPTDYRSGRPPGLRMRNTGRVLAIVGGAMLTGGIIVFSQADETYYRYTSTNNGSYEEGDPKAAIGIAMMLSGAGMAIPGIILWTRGARKYNTYQKRQQEAGTASMKLKGSGISISYHF
jgi:hypothetical protein